jgi:N-acetylglucosaminyldiphosphoundecaprenol N-acetyl-beta-D-mannosaminyltransferase
MLNTAEPMASATIVFDAPRAHSRLAVRRCANVLGVPVNALNMEEAISLIAERLQFGPKGYVCAIGVHGILEALWDRSVANALASAAIGLPDGAPIVWVGRLQGHRAIDHVTGPAMMRQVFSRREFAGYSHFFYGGKAGVAEELSATMRRQFPWIRVSGTYTPPFRSLTPEEESEIVARINDARPDMIWVGISTPRQDLFMQRMIPRLDTRLMFGVGAAFDFLTGRIRDCPNWVKQAGLHWLQRLAQDPKRLWRRNLSNTAFLWHIGLQLTGMKSYPLIAGGERCASEICCGRPAEAYSSSRERDQ